MATKSAAIIVTTPRIFHEWLLVSWEGKLLLPLDEATEVRGPFGCEQFYTKYGLVLISIFQLPSIICGRVV
jgi:hypothetical protein